MSFKIIQETSKTGFVLAIIPEAFEYNGVFWYPPSNWSSKRRNMAIKNAYAQPDKSSWVARLCVVKKNKIKSYTIAEQLEEELLVKNITTEDDQNDSDDSTIDSTGTTNRTKNSNGTRSPQANFDEIAHSAETIYFNESNETIDALNFISVKKMKPPRSEVTPTIGNLSGVNCSNVIRSASFYHQNENNAENLHTVSIPKLNSAMEENYIFRTVSIEPPTTEDTSQSTNVIEIMFQLLENQDQILKNPDVIKNNINTGFLKLFTQIETLIKGGALEPSQIENNENNLFSMRKFTKVGTLEEAKSLDRLLQSEENVNRMVDQMGYVAGRNGNRIGEGWICCYELVHNIFHRSFLVTCSWTGASTSKEDGIAAKCHKISQSGKLTKKKIYRKNSTQKRPEEEQANRS